MHYIVQLVPYEGEDTALWVEGGDTLFCIVTVSEEGAAIVDNGYRSVEEAKAAWPEAKEPSSVVPSQPRGPGEQRWEKDLDAPGPLAAQRLLLKLMLQAKST